MLALAARETVTTERAHILIWGSWSPLGRLVRLVVAFAPLGLSALSGICCQSAEEEA